MEPFSFAINSAEKSGPSISFTIGKRDRKKITMLVSVAVDGDDSQVSSFTGTYPVKFLNQRPSNVDQMYIQVRHFIGIDDNIVCESTEELAAVNTKQVTVNFLQGSGRCVIIHATTRRETASQWQVKDTRRIRMWLQMCICQGDQVISESSMQEIVFRNGIQKDSSDDDGPSPKSISPGLKRPLSCDESDRPLTRERCAKKRAQDAIESQISQSPPSTPPGSSQPQQSSTPTTKPVVVPIPVTVQRSNSYNFGRVFEMIKDVKPEIDVCERDLLLMMMQHESLYMPRPCLYTTRQPYIHQRNMMIDSMVYHALNLRISDIQLETAVNYLDRVLAVSPSTPWLGGLLELAMVCFYLACRYEQDIPLCPLKEEFIKLAECSVERFNEIEDNVLSVVEPLMNAITPRMFLKKYLSIIKADRRVSVLSNYLCESCLVDPMSVRYSPSAIASSSLFLSMLMLSVSDKWNAFFDGYNVGPKPALNDPCVQDIVNLCNNPMYHSVRVKFTPLLSSGLDIGSTFNTPDSSPVDSNSKCPIYYDMNDFQACLQDTF